MATVQDYLNMAVSLTVGNKSGTDNQVFLPNDFRKLSDLKVKRFNFRTITVAAGATSKITTLYSNDSLCLVFFSHPVLITHINNVSLGSDTLKLSLFCAGRNVTGSANFKVNSGSNEGILTFDNTLASPAFTSVTSTGSEQAELDLIALNVEFES